jgi:hypothetical protein
MDSLPVDNNSGDVAAQIAIEAHRRRLLAAVQSSDIAPPLPLSVPPPGLEIIPTIYPAAPTATITIENYVTINIHSAEFKAFEATVNGLLEALRGSNAISREVGDQLISEMKAGMELLRSPKPNRNLIDVLLARPLLYIAAIASAISTIAATAKQAYELLRSLIGSG